MGTTSPNHNSNSYNIETLHSAFREEEAEESSANDAHQADGACLLIGHLARIWACPHGTTNRRCPTHGAALEEHVQVTVRRHIRSFNTVVDAGHGGTLPKRGKMPRCENRLSDFRDVMKKEIRHLCAKMQDMAE